MQSDSVSVIPEGMEVDEWGGIDSVTQYKCRNGKCPRHMLCWDGPNTGRRHPRLPTAGKVNDVPLCEVD